MPIFAYFVVAGSVLITLLFLWAHRRKKARGELRSVISDVQSLPMPWRPDRKQALSDAVPALAGHASPLVLAAQPEDESPSEVLAKSAATDQKQIAARHSREADIPTVGVNVLFRR